MPALGKSLSELLSVGSNRRGVHFTVPPRWLHLETEAAAATPAVEVGGDDSGGGSAAAKAAKAVEVEVVMAAMVAT